MSYKRITLKYKRISHHILNILYFKSVPPLGNTNPFPPLSLAPGDPGRNPGGAPGGGPPRMDRACFLIDL